MGRLGRTRETETATRSGAAGRGAQVGGGTDRAGRAGHGGGRDGGEVAELVRRLAELEAAGAAGEGEDAAAGGAASGGPGTAVAVRPASQLIRAEIERRARIEHDRRARRLPYVATGATAAAGYAAWGVGELAAAGAGPGGALLATGSTAALSALTLGVLRVTYRDRIAEQWRRGWWSAGAGAAGWVTAASAVGAGSWTMSAILAVAAAASSVSWLRAHEAPRPGDDAPAPVQPEPVIEVVQDLGDEFARRWADNIARKSGAVPGSLITNRRDLPHAIRWTVQTPPGSTTFAQVFANRDRVASGLRVSPTKVILERSDADESYVELTVITTDTLTGGVAYPGPRYHQGRIPLAQFADGAGEAEYVAYDEVGPRSGMATGEPGSGKSAFLEAVALGLRSSGEWQVWFGDGDPEGGSSPLLNEIADWPEAGPEAVYQQLLAIEALIEVRSMLKPTLTADPATGLPVPITNPALQRQVRELRPCPQYPSVKWILDELHRLTSDPWLKAQGFAVRLEKAVRIGRKYGIVALTGSQSLLAPDYGNQTPLRGYLAARNLFAFRNGNRSETAVVSGLEIAPSTLPAGGGYCYVAGTGRLAMARVGWASDMARHAAGLPATPLDPDSALAAARFRAATSRDPADVYAERIARLGQWRAAQHNQTDSPHQMALPTPTRTSQTPAAAGNAAHLGTAGGGAGGAGGGGAAGRAFGRLAGLAVPAALTADNVVPLTPRRPPAPVDTSPAPAAAAARPAAVRENGPDLAVLTAPQRAVYGALCAGHQHTGQIAETTGLLKPAVSKALSALTDLGLARKLAHGHYGPTTGSAIGAAPTRLEEAQ